MKIYIDSEYKCHTSPAEGLIEIETSAFDNKCKAYIEGFRFVPEGATWIREDGMEFIGEMVAPWKDYNVLAAYQEQYEEMISEQQDMQTALETLGVNANG